MIKTSMTYMKWNLFSLANSNMIFLEGWAHTPHTPTSTFLLLKRINPAQPSNSLVGKKNQKPFLLKQSNQRGLQCILNSKSGKGSQNLGCKVQPVDTEYLKR